MSSQRGSGVVVVLGSLNADLVLSVAALPVPGQTVSAHELHRRPGGKGANQAVAAARAGARVAMVGAVGDDADGDLLLTALQRDGIDVERVRRLPGTPTGLAVVAVQPDGENTVTVVPAANGTLDASDAEAAAALVAAGDILLLQLEVPVPAVAAAARKARAAGVRVLLNAAPSQPIHDLLDDVDVLVVNEHECLDMARDHGEPVEAAQHLAQRHALLVVVTLGARGAAWTRGGPAETQPAPAVRAVDSTGAGDTFCGYLAATLSVDMDVAAAVQRATAAASLAVTRQGAQDGIPSAADVPG